MGERLQMRKADGTSQPEAHLDLHASEPSQVATSQPANPELDRDYGFGSINTMRKELDDCFAHMKEFFNTEPDEVIRYVSGYSARFSEIRMLVQRYETPMLKRFRTAEVEPCLEELRQQFQVASRRIAMRELDFRMDMGQP